MPGNSETGETVLAPLNYTIATSGSPVDKVRAAGDGRGDRIGIVFDTHHVTIRDARPLVARFNLDREGVVLLDHKTAVRSFYDDAEVVAVGYPEAEALVKAATGADEVLVFDHTIRIDDEEKQSQLPLEGDIADE